MPTNILMPEFSMIEARNGPIHSAVDRVICKIYGGNSASFSF